MPHFDAKGEANQLLHRARRADHVPADLVLLGQPDPLRDGPEAGPGRRSSLFTLPMGDKKLPGIAAEDIGRCAYGIFKRGPELIGKTVGIAGEHLTGAEMAAALARALGERGAATTRCRPRSTAASASPAPRTSATCSSSSATSRRVLRRARSLGRARPQPGAADLRRLARRQYRAHSDRIGGGLRPAPKRDVKTQVRHGGLG